MTAPKLRFPEFDHNWIKANLSTLLTFENGINASNEQYGHGTKFINVLDIINNSSIIHKNIIGSVNIASDEFKKMKCLMAISYFKEALKPGKKLDNLIAYL